VSNAWPSFPILIKPNVPEIAVQVHLTHPLTQWLATTNLLAGHSHHGFRAYQTQVMPASLSASLYQEYRNQPIPRVPKCRDILCSKRWGGGMACA